MVIDHMYSWEVDPTSIPKTDEERLPPPPVDSVREAKILKALGIVSISKSGEVTREEQ